MAQNNSYAGSKDIRDYMDAAVEAENGIKLRLGDRKQAVRLRQRMYSLRYAIRKESFDIYRDEPQMQGKSPWDSLTIDIDENHDLILKKFNTNIQMEPL